MMLQSITSNLLTRNAVLLDSDSILASAWVLPSVRGAYFILINPCCLVTPTNAREVFSGSPKDLSTFNLSKPVPITMKPYDLVLPMLAQANRRIRIYKMEIN